MRSLLLLSGMAALMTAQSLAAQTREDMRFLEFPIATSVSSADTPAFAWIVRRGQNSMLMFAEAPSFKPVKLFEQTDVDGQPVTSATVSPDGKWVAFVTGVPIGGNGDAVNAASLIETPKAVLWVIPAKAGAQPVRIGTGSSPRFTPDGKRMIVREGRDLMSIDLADPSAKPTLHQKGAAGLGQAIWSKDGKSMIFVQDRGGWSFLGRYTLGEDRVEWLVKGADLIRSPVLSPDGRTVAYLRAASRGHEEGYDRTENRPFSLEALDLDTKAARTLFDTKANAGWSSSDDGEGHLRWSDDRTVVLRSEHDGWARLYAIPRTGGAPRALTPTNCEAVENELAAPDLLFVVHNCRNIDTRQISAVVVSTGKEQPLASKDVAMAQARAIGDGRYVAFTGTTADVSPLLRVLDLKTQKLVLAEKPSDYGYTYRFAAPAPQQVHFKATDGATVAAQLFLPSTPGPHPAMVYVHGGPKRQMFPAFHTGIYYAADYAVNRRLAELGYVVISVNYRSGAGYGLAFREAPGRGWREASEYRDILGAGRWLAERSDVDPKRIGIWGGSYGGMLTGQALARNSDLFAAGIAIHSNFDWSRRSLIPGHLNPSLLYGVGENDKEVALRSSPLGAIDGWTSPVLLVSGDRDMTVDVRETVDLNRRLRAKGVDVRTVLLPNEEHMLVRYSSRLELWSESRRFLAEKLGQ